MAKLVETTYGEALFELAVQESKVDELCEEAQAVIDIFKDNEDLVNVLKSPKVEKKEKEQLIENIFKKFVSEDITGLLVIMVSKDRQTKKFIIRYICRKCICCTSYTYFIHFLYCSTFI